MTKAVRCKKVLPCRPDLTLYPAARPKARQGSWKGDTAVIVFVRRKSVNFCFGVFGGYQREMLKSSR